MARRDSSSAGATPRSPDKAASLLHAGLDALSFCFAVFDKDMKLVTSNKAFRTLRGYTAA